MDDALRRFANPTLGHTCAQVGSDGSSKLPQRLLPVVAARQERALETGRFALVVAIWLAATAGVEARGVRLPCLEDPRAGELRDAASRHCYFLTAQRPRALPGTPTTRSPPRSHRLWCTSTGEGRGRLAGSTSPS